MKNFIKKLVAFITVSVLILTSVGISAFAQDLPLIDVSVKNTSDGKYCVIISINNSSNLQNADISVRFPENVTVNTVSLKDTSADKYANGNSSLFLCDYSAFEHEIKYSACFAESLTGDENFSLCKIELTAESITDNTVFTVKYTLQTAELTNDSLAVFSFSDGKLKYDESHEYFLVGDVNGDGSVSASDARITLRYSVGLEKVSPDRLPYMNCDGNDSITAADARMVLRTSVGLEDTKIRCYNIVLSEGDTCENAKSYKYTCSLTGTVFTLSSSDTGHIYSRADCYEAEKCVICGKTVSKSKGHNFKDGFCVNCYASESEITKVKEDLIPVFEEITDFDTLACEAAENGDFSEYLTNTEYATQRIKIALDKCRDINGLKHIAENLQTAYSLRYEAFLKCTDSKGCILANRRTFNTVSAAVYESNKYIDSAYYSLN